MAGEGARARTGTVSAGETDVGNFATIAAFHEILRRMLVGPIHLASLLLRGSRGPLTGHTMNAGYAHLDRIAEVTLAWVGFYQMGIVTAPVRLLRLFRSCSNWKACRDDMPTDSRSRPRFFFMCGSLPRSGVEIVTARY